MKIPDLAYLHRVGNRLLDRHLRRRGKRLAFRVGSARTRCEKDVFGPVTRARTLRGLAPREVALDLPGAQQISSPVVDPRAAATDPVAASTQSGRGCIVTTLPIAPGVASWTTALPRRFALIGMPRLSLRVEGLASDLQLAARLWDVAPDGAQTLVTRGAHRVAGTSIGGQRVGFELFGNHWRFERGHRLLLELSADDSPFLRRNNFPGAATVDSVRLVLPGRE